MDDVLSVALGVVGIAAIVWGAERFAENLARAATRLGVSTFALALLLAGAEPEELATAVTASLRGAPAIAFGDVVGANVTTCLVALGVGALVAPLPFGRRVLRYGLLALPAGVGAVAVAWDGRVGRMEGGLLVLVYVGYVAVIWRAERRPPALGETAELSEATEEAGRETGRVGQELVVVVAGLVAMVLGATLLVDAVERLVDAEAAQVRLSLTVVGFATGFELVVLAWSAARRGISEAVVAGVVGSYAYNATMTLGAAALVRPLRLVNAAPLRAPMLAMVLILAGVLLASRGRHLGRLSGYGLLGAYVAFVVLVIVT